MTGKVIRVRNRGVEAQMDSAGTPVGQWQVIRASDGSVACVVSPRKASKGVANGWKFNWDSAPAVLPAIGDMVQLTGA